MKPTPQFYTFCVIGCALTLNAVADRRWNDANDPLANFDATYVTNYNRLPQHGDMESKNKGWSDTYWPSSNGSIVDRWQVQVKNPDKRSKKTFKDDVTPSVEQLQILGESAIDKLSPAEKFDLAAGHRNFPLTNEIRSSVVANQEGWHGICDGWTKASLNYDEPHPFVYENKELNLRIPFGSSDVKGLLAYYHNSEDPLAGSTWKMIGKRCYHPGFFDFGNACEDVHPAAFHIVVANELGLRHKGFAADSDPGKEIWNQPYVSYKMQIDDVATGRDISRNATKGTVREIYITNHVMFAEELYVPNPENVMENTSEIDPITGASIDHDDNYAYGLPTGSYQPVMGTAKQHYQVIDYKYLLELDANDNIIGGEWLSWQRPDYIWKADVSKPNGQWQLLSDIVEKATAYLH